MNDATWIADLLAHGLIRYCADRDKEQLTKPLFQRLRDLGVDVEVKAA